MRPERGHTSTSSACTRNPGCMKKAGHVGRCKIVFNFNSIDNSDLPTAAPSMDGAIPPPGIATTAEPAPAVAAGHTANRTGLYSLAAAALTTATDSSDSDGVEEEEEGMFEQSTSMTYAHATADVEVAEPEAAGGAARGAEGGEGAESGGIGAGTSTAISGAAVKEVQDECISFSLQAVVEPNAHTVRLEKPYLRTSTRLPIGILKRHDTYRLQSSEPHSS